MGREGHFSSVLLFLKSSQSPQTKHEKAIRHTPTERHIKIPDWFPSKLSVSWKAKKDRQTAKIQGG